MFQVGGSCRDAWRCKMPSETLLPRGAQQHDGMDEAGVEGLTGAGVTGRGGFGHQDCWASEAQSDGTTT